MLIAKGRSRMDQKKIGLFLKELRKKGVIQEQLAVTVLTFEGADAQKFLIYLIASRRLLKA